MQERPQTNEWKIQNCRVLQPRLILLCTAALFNVFVVAKHKICEYLIDYISLNQKWYWYQHPLL